MQHKRVFVLNGHPGAASLSRTLATDYATAAMANGHDVRMTHLHDLSFDMDYGEGGYDAPKPLEPALESVLRDLEWSEHVVLAAPMWWGGIPAKLKGLFDRAFLPGRTFDTRKTTRLGKPTPLLSGRSARLILTADTPGWFLRLVHGNAIIRQLSGHILGFVGIAPTRVTYLAGASHPQAGLVDSWRKKVARLGEIAA